MGVASPCQWGMGECWEPSGCSRETAPGPATVKQASWRWQPEGGQSCGAGGSAHVVRWACESSGVLRLRSRLARYGPSGSPERSHRWKSAGFSVSSSFTAAGLGGGVRGVRTTSRMGPPRPSHSASARARLRVQPSRFRRFRVTFSGLRPSAASPTPRPTPDLLPQPHHQTTPPWFRSAFFLISLDRPRHSRTTETSRNHALQPQCGAG